LRAEILRYKFNKVGVMLHTWHSLSIHRPRLAALKNKCSPRSLAVPTLRFPISNVRRGSRDEDEWGRPLQSGSLAAFPGTARNVAAVTIRSLRSLKVSDENPFQ
jgi:hypothetical protein